MSSYPTITNWKDLVSQFGLNKAKEFSKELRNHKQEMFFIKYDPKTTDAILIFEYDGFINNSHTFTYTGTAN